jgi:quercetin dioxygenase-like cupin family protein
MPAFKGSELKKELIEPDYSSARGSIVRGEKIGVVMFACPAGTEVKPHARRNEQIQSIIKGKAKYRVGGEEKVVGPGEAVLIRPHTEYSARIMEDLEVISFEDVGPGGPGKQEAVKGPAFFKWVEMESDFITPQYSKGKGPTIRGERIEVAFMTYPVGAEGKTHSHPNEQIQVALKGKVSGRLGGEIYILEPGDIVLKPSNIEQSGQVLEDYTTLNCKDIVPGWSVYHARWEK